MRRIAVVNQKGGVGKTTTAANLGHALARKGNRVLLVDLDPQSHLASFFGLVEKVHGVDKVILDDAPLASLIVELRPRLSILPAGINLQQIELNCGEKKPGSRLRQRLQQEQDWDFVIIDAPPSSGLLVVMAVYAANELLIPVTSDYLGLQGLSHLMATLKNFEQLLQHKPRRRLVITRFYPRRKISLAAQQKLQQYFPRSLLPTPIREVTAIASSPGFGKSAFEHQSGNHGAEDYGRLAVDLIRIGEEGVKKQ